MKELKEFAQLEEAEKLITELEKKLGALGKTLADPLRKTITAMKEIPDLKKNITDVEAKISELREQLRTLRGRLDTVVHFVGVENLESLLGKEMAENVKKALGITAFTQKQKEGRATNVNKMGIIYCGRRFEYLTWFVQKYVADSRYRTPAKFITYLSFKKIPYKIETIEGKQYLILDQIVDIVHMK